MTAKGISTSLWLIRYKESRIEAKFTKWILINIVNVFLRERPIDTKEEIRIRSPNLVTETNSKSLIVLEGEWSLKNVKQLADWHQE